MQAKGKRSSGAKAILHGAFGFAMVSLGGFAVWAFAGSWFYRNVGEAGLYATSMIVFVGLAGLFLSPLVIGPNRLIRFQMAFIPAFVAYAIVWCVCWFALKFGAGEWLGSLLGCAAFAWVLGQRLGSMNGFYKVVLILFVGHSAGYFLGGIFYMSKAKPEILNGLSRQQVAIIGRMLWGLPYGLGFGAGIGWAFHSFQQSAPPKAGVS